MKRKKKGKKRGQGLTSFLIFLFLFVLANDGYAEQRIFTYEDVVQKNIELRKKIQQEQQKYMVLKNERNVLILHVRRLQSAGQENLYEEKFVREEKEFKEQLQKNKDLTVEKQDLEARLAKLKEVFEQRAIENQDLKIQLRKVNNEFNSIQTDFQDREEKLKIEKVNFRDNLERVMLEAKASRGKIEELEQQLLITRTHEQELDKELQTRFSAQIQQEEQIEELKIDKFSTEAKLAKQAENILEKAREIADKKINTIEQKTDKERLDMHYNLAVVFDKNGMYEDSEREYLKCLRINPDDPDVHYNLAILYDDKLNKNLAAIKHYKKYLELHPKGEEASQVRQWILLAEQENRIGPEMR